MSISFAEIQEGPVGGQGSEWSDKHLNGPITAIELYTINVLGHKWNSEISGVRTR